MTLPAWLEPLPDAAVQRATDTWAIEGLRIPARTLMERAGTGLAEHSARLCPEGRIVVVCGKGNNGGDGFVAARLLREQGRAVDVLLIADADEYRGDAKLNLERLGGEAHPFLAERLKGAALIIDAILGTGFQGEAHGKVAVAIDAINSAAGRGQQGAASAGEARPVQVIACDVPSGVDASTGEVPGAAVEADLTVTFQAAKPGLWVHPGKAHARRVRVIDIGIPPEAAAGPQADREPRPDVEGGKSDAGEAAGVEALAPGVAGPHEIDLLAASNWLPIADLTAASTGEQQGSRETEPGDPQTLAAAAPVDPRARVMVGRIGPAVRDQIPRRGLRSNKFTAGSVLVCGGSRGLSGAPVMSATAAARAGAGYVTVAAPESVAATIEAKLLEIMTVALPDELENGLKRGTSRMLVERAARAQALVLGPGLGRLPATAVFATAVAQYANLPLVIDADALNALAARAGAGTSKSRAAGRSAAAQKSEDAEDRGPEPLALLRGRAAPTVLTPHVGELARLLQTTSAAIDARRLHHARLAATSSGAVVVLKGDDTLVAAPDGRVAVSPGAAPALSTAGTGDVLSGIIGAFLAKGVDPFIAACAAVDTHLRAGRLAAKQIGPEGVIASDVIAAIPRVLAQSRRGGDS